MNERKAVLRCESTESRSFFADTCAGMSPDQSQTIDRREFASFPKTLSGDGFTRLGGNIQVNSGNRFANATLTTGARGQRFRVSGIFRPRQMPLSRRAPLLFTASTVPSLGHENISVESHAFRLFGRCNCFICGPNRARKPKQAIIIKTTKHQKL